MKNTIKLALLVVICVFSACSSEPKTVNIEDPKNATD